MKNKILIFVGVIILAAFILKILNDNLVIIWSTRYPNNNEKAYNAIAFDTLSPDLCSKISPRAGEISWSEFGILRYECFMYLASQTNNPELCKKIDSFIVIRDLIPSPLPTHSSPDRRFCQGHYNSFPKAVGPTFPSINYDEFFSLLGYSEPTDGLGYAGLFTKLIDKRVPQQEYDDFMKRVRALPDYSKE